MLSINYFKCQVKYLNMNGKHYMTMALIDMAIQNQVSQKLWIITTKSGLKSILRIKRLKEIWGFYNKYLCRMFLSRVVVVKSK